jgi:hypothetical protein
MNLKSTKIGILLLILVMVMLVFSGVAFAADAANLTSVNLSANGQTKTVTFSAPGTTETVELNQYWGTGSINVQPIAPTASTITVSGYLVASGSSMEISTNPIEIVVDGANTYTINIVRVNTDLSSVLATVTTGGSEITLTKTGNTYKGIVAENTGAIDITATTASSDATMFCAYGTPTVSGSNTMTWSNININSLTAGSSNAFIIQVRSDTQSTDYEVEITKLSSTELADATLSALRVKDGSTSGTDLLGSFNKDVLTYNMTASNATAYICPTVSSSAAKVTVNGSNVNSGDYKAVSLNTNGTATSVPVVVTAGDGTTKTYTLNITLSSASLTDCTLSSVVARYSSKNYTATVSSSTYTINVPYGASSVSVTVNPKISAATYYVSSSSSTPAASSTYWSTGVTALNLSYGTNTYYIHVKAQNGYTTNRYTLYIKRANTDSDDDTLRALAVRGTTNSSTSSGSTYNLMPTFDRDTNTYYIAVPNSVNYARITATAADSNAVITVDGTTVTSGSLSNAVSLSTSTSGNTIPIVVTSPSGSYSTKYYVKIYRSSRSGDTNTSARKLLVRAGTSSSSSKQSVVGFTSDFSPSTTSYKVSVDYDQTYAALRWDQDDSNSIAFLITKDAAYKLSDGYYSNSIKLSSGENTWTVRVYASNYSNYKDYTVKIYRGGTSKDAYLKSLFVSLDNGTANWSSTFSKTNTSYTITIPAGATYARITPTLNYTSANIKVNGSTVNNNTTSSKIYFSSTKTVKVVVTAEDGYTTQTYTLNFRQAAVAKYNKIVLRIGSSKAVLDGTTSNINVTPYLSGSTTMVPIRFISESMGYTVDYNSKTKLITISNGIVSFTMTVGKTIAGLNVTPIIKGSTTYVPLRYVNNQLGLKTDWNNTSKEITITP